MARTTIAEMKAELEKVTEALHETELHRADAVAEKEHLRSELATAEQVRAELYATGAELERRVQALERENAVVLHTLGTITRLAQDAVPRLVMPSLTERVGS